MQNVVPEYSYHWWINQLEKDEKRLRDGWWTAADKIVNKFKGKKTNSGTEAQDSYILNIFWANVGVMKAALYGKKPRPIVKPIWQDMNDAPARVAAIMLERCLNYDLMKNQAPMDAAIKLAVEDWLIPGMGMIWLRYESVIETETVPGTPIKVDVVTDEKVACDYVHWRDVVMPSARTTEELWYLGRKIYMTRKDIEKRFNIKIGEKDPEDKAPDQDNVLPKNFKEDKVCLYELWCKKTRKIYWVCREISGFCKVKDDFLRLEDFYPCPFPLMATHTTDDYLPRPDYTMMKDQYEQLNELNSRITILEKALRVVGVYDKKNAEVQRILSEARENDMIPVDKWAVLGEAGGLKGVVDWFPIEMIADVLDKLREQKLEKKQEIYELSGISDIMRGATNPRETLGAQKLKAQFGSVRLESRQDEIAQFVRQALTIKAEIICEHFQPQTIARLSNIMMTPDAQHAEAAMQIVKDEKLMRYRVDINEQTLALPDYQQEQANRMEFLTTVGQFLSQAGPILETAPQSMPHLLQMIRWTASSFKGSNEIQGILDQAIASAQGAPLNQGGEGQPEDVVGAEQVKQQGETAKQQMQGQQKKEEIKLTKDLELRNEMQMFKLEHGAEMQTAMMEQQHEAAMTNQEMMHDDAAMDRQHEQNMESTQVAHENSLEQGEQSGDVQLEVSKLRNAGGNRPKNK